MQRLVKPSDYVLQDVLGQPMYLIPWESRFCPGNPTEDPDSGAQLYNDFVIDKANGVLPQTPAEQMNEILDWVLEISGESARNLAADLAEAYLGKHAFLINELEQWDAESKDGLKYPPVFRLLSHRRPQNTAAVQNRANLPSISSVFSAASASQSSFPTLRTHLSCAAEQISTCHPQVRQGE